MSYYRDEEFNFKSHLDSEPEPDYLIDVPKNDFRAKMTEILLPQTAEYFIDGKPMTVVFCPREVWGALPPKESPPPRPVKHPVTYVSFPDTRTESCMNPDECVLILRQLQKDHMAEGYRDIKYNFMVGFDGVVYEGRGWHEDADRIEEHEEEIGGNPCLDIGLIGDSQDQFQRTIYPSPPMEKAAWAWATYGQGENNYVSDDSVYLSPHYRELKSINPKYASYIMNS